MKIRTFIALEIADVIKEQLTHIQRQLMNKGAELKWIKKENIHLTLKFLGEIDENNHNKIFELMNHASENAGSLNLSLSELGMFPDEKRPNTIWVGIGGEVEEVRQLAERCDYYLSTIGFEKSKNNFKPHLTIGRIKKITNKKQFISEVNDIKVSRAAFRVKKLHVVKSELMPAGAVYTNIHTIHFNN